MTVPRFDVTPFLVQDEGQHFDRKSLFEGPDESKRPRDRRSDEPSPGLHFLAFSPTSGSLRPGPSGTGRLPA